MAQRKNRQPTQAKPAKDKKPKTRGTLLNKEEKKGTRANTPRQLVAVKKLSDIVRSSKGQKNITLGKLLREAGYSEETSKKPGRVVKAKSFQELLDHYLPDDAIAEVHGDLMKASKLDHYIFPLGAEDDDIREIIESVSGCRLVKIKIDTNWKRAYFWTPDNMSRMKAIAEAYKIKNKYPAEKHEHTVAIVETVNYGDPK